ncbi:hypothetical protein Tco_0150550 [Tanacetum coccineum]
MIQSEPEGSTQGYPLDSVEVLRKSGFQYIVRKNHKEIAALKTGSSWTSDAMHNHPRPPPPGLSKDSYQFSRRLHAFLSTLSLRESPTHYPCDVARYNRSDNYFTVKMEICLSNNQTSSMVEMDKTDANEFLKMINTHDACAHKHLRFGSSVKEKTANAASKPVRRFCGLLPDQGSHATFFRHPMTGNQPRNLSKDRGNSIDIKEFDNSF